MKKKNTKDILETSIILTNYNGMPFLKYAVKSILNQTYRNFELILVDDGSTDDSKKYLQSIKDKRVILLLNKKNKGQTFCLNKALKISKGKFISRMDSDDIAFKNRLEKQVNFLNKNKEIDIVGSQVRLIDENGKKIGKIILPCSSSSIWAYSLMHNPFVHPTVTIRKKILNSLDKIYDNKFINQDFELWSRLLLDIKAANLNEILLYYRQHQSNMSKTFLEKNLHSTSILIEKRLKNENIFCDLKLEEIEKIQKYFLNDRKYANQKKIKRLDLGKQYFKFYNFILSKYKINNEIKSFIVNRLLISSFQFNIKNLKEFFYEIKFLLQIFIKFPIYFLRCITILFFRKFFFYGN